MSYYDDFESYRLGAEEWNDYNIPARRKVYLFETLNNKWQTRDGKVLKLSKMDFNHLCNVRNYIIRCCNYSHLNPYDYPIYNNILKEIEKRKRSR